MRHGSRINKSGACLQIAEKVSHDHVAPTGRSDDSVSPLNARMELVGRLAVGLAHDLNGPIGVMLGFTQLAREKLESDDASAQKGVVEYLKMIENAGENARSLAQDMWEFAKTASGEIVEYDFAELLETTARLVAPSLRIAAIEPPGAGELSSQMVTGDRAMWAQALVGVMIEAPTALPGGGSVSWGLIRAEDGKSLIVEIVASPNDPKTSAITPIPAKEWSFRESCTAIIQSLGGSLGPLSGLNDERRGVEISIPS